MVIKKLLVILFWSNFCNCIQEGDDLHSSIIALNDVFNVEKLLIENLANYIIRSEENINFFKGLLNNVVQDNYNISNNVNQRSVIKDSINSFLLKRKLSVNLPAFRDNLSSTTTKTIENFTKIETKNDLPGIADLDGATLGILRVQEIYGISAEEIANGVINGIDFRTKFTAYDCLAVALKLRAMDFHYYAIGWLNMTLKRLKQEGWKGIIPEVDKIVILDLLINSKVQEGSIENIKEAIEMSIEILKENYSDESALHFAENLKQFVEQYIALKLGENQSTSSYPPKGTIYRYNVEELNLLKRGCRGELTKPPAELRKLFCRYESKNHQFLILAPIKVEVLNLEPYLVVFHDVMYDSEIEILKELSKRKLTRAGVWNQAKGVGEPSTARTSKFFWISNDTHPVLHTLNQRVSDMTGLTVSTAENFQLMNYGIGGHYDLHPDYFTEPSEDNDAKPYGYYEWGNRIATVLFYMSDVAHGGGTTWPNINVLTLPKKGCAAFWYNLFADGKPNYLARHSACPIIAGSKWVINKWLRIRGQEFRRPCLSYPDHLGKPKG